MLIANIIKYTYYGTARFGEGVQCGTLMKRICWDPVDKILSK